MRLVNRDGSSELTLAAVDRDVEYPSVRITVALRTTSLQACYSIWFGQRQLDSFANAVAALERTRDGVARLESLSPNECGVLLRRTDALGGMAVDLSLDDLSGTERISVSFDFDPSLLFPAVDAANHLSHWQR